MEVMMGTIIAVEGLADVCIEKTLGLLKGELEDRKRTVTIIDHEHRNRSSVNILRSSFSDERTQGAVTLIEEIGRYESAVRIAERERDSIVFLIHAFGGFYAKWVWGERFPESAYNDLTQNREQEINLTLWFETGLTDERSRVIEAGYRARAQKMGWARVDARLDEERTPERIAHECLALILLNGLKEREEVISR